MALPRFASARLVVPTLAVTAGLDCYLDTVACIRGAYF